MNKGDFVLETFFPLDGWQCLDVHLETVPADFQRLCFHSLFLRRPGKTFVLEKPADRCMTHGPILPAEDARNGFPARFAVLIPIFKNRLLLFFCQSAAPLFGGGGQIQRGIPASPSRYSAYVDPESLGELFVGQPFFLMKFFYLLSLIYRKRRISMEFHAFIISRLILHVNVLRQYK